MSSICITCSYQYSFDGYLYEIFHSQKFDVSGASISGLKVSGDSILDSVFGQIDVQPWPMFFVLLAWVGLFRLTHYALFFFQLRDFLPKRI